MNEQKILELTKDPADDFYINAFHQISSGQRIVWNWAAFLGSFMWMFYRKMYLRSFLWCIVISYSVLSFFIYPAYMKCKDISVNVIPLHAIGVFLLLLLFTWCGLFGTKMYYKNVKNKMEKAIINSHYKATTSEVLNCILIYYLALFIGIAIYYFTDQSLLDAQKAVVNQPLFTAVELKYSVIIPLYFFASCFTIFIIAVVGIYEFIRNKLHLSKVQELVDGNSISIENAHSLIHTKSEQYYLKKFREIEKKKLISTNFTAFYAGWAWFLYKKMYGIGMIFATVSILDLILIIAYPRSTISRVINILDWFLYLFLFFGGANRLYYNFCIKKSLEEK